MTITLKHNKEEFFSVLKKGGQRGRIGENLREIQKKKVKSLRKKKSATKSGWSQTTQQIEGLEIKLEKPLKTLDNKPLANTQSDPSLCVNN